MEDATMAAPARLTRQKISTTISPRTLSYLQQLIDSGEVQTLADAVDLVIERLLVFENRERLDNDTAAYFANLSPEAEEEESRLGSALANSARGVNVDREP
jgi:hypothetical protein